MNRAQTDNYIFYFLVLVLLTLLNLSCNLQGYTGNYPLGNHLWLWDNDRKEEKIIVYCEGDCNGGIYVVPTYKRHYDSIKHNFSEYVEAAVSDKNWVVAKTLKIKEHRNLYYIISKAFNIEHVNCSKVNCDSILQSCVIGPLSKNEFKKREQLLNIDLDL